MMSNAMILGLMLGCGSVLVACCDDEGGRCDGLLMQISIDASIVDGGPIGAAETSLRGFVHRPDTLTIYSLVIAGQNAISEDGDFRQFSVKLPKDTMTTMSGNDATLPVALLTNCDTLPYKDLTVMVAMRPPGDGTVVHSAILAAGEFKP
ncbi:MAG TPA: hypothetical protein VHN14_02395 [Kofleriaceae bacterium]|jgi:hypothetical protein|nr:hypothetical protein [Kofleriaceae bacterium]